MSKISGYNDYLKHIEDGCHSNMKNGRCIKCGECCSNLLPMSANEIFAIRRYMEKHDIKESVHAYPMKNLMDMTCPFLSQDNKCNIYPVRPKICRIYHCNKKSYELDKNKLELLRYCQVTDVRKTFFR